MTGDIVINKRMNKTFASNLVKDIGEKEAHMLLVELSKKFSITSFVETHDSSYKAWPCPICESKRYKQEGWEGVSYI